LNAAGTVIAQQKISDTAGNFTAPLVNLDELGGAVINLGDLDGSGPAVTAMGVGAGGDDNGGPSRGAVYTMFLAANGTVLSYQKYSDTQGNFTAILDDTDEFGGAVAALGDLDGPGPSEQAFVGCASFDDDGGEDRGASTSCSSMA
jgi:hypothetical protein